MYMHDFSHHVTCLTFSEVCRRFCASPFVLSRTMCSERSFWYTSRNLTNLSSLALARAGEDQKLNGTQSLDVRPFMYVCGLQIRTHYYAHIHTNNNATFHFTLSPLFSVRSFNLTFEEYIFLQKYELCVIMCTAVVAVFTACEVINQHMTLILGNYVSLYLLWLSRSRATHLRTLQVCSAISL